MTMAACLTTGPATLAGNLVVGNAEVIAGTALIQLAYPEVPVFYAAAQTASDLRTGAYTGGGPEDYLFGAATNVLSDFYDIPLSMGSFATGAKQPNWQAGVDNSFPLYGQHCHVRRCWGWASARQPHLVVRRDAGGSEIYSTSADDAGIVVDDETLALAHPAGRR
jgi:trimethylamine--corrinoid protein Co-methyltransferase